MHWAWRGWPRLYSKAHIAYNPAYPPGLAVTHSGSSDCPAPAGLTTSRSMPSGPSSLPPSFHSCHPNPTSSPPFLLSTLVCGPHPTIWSISRHRLSLGAIRRHGFINRPKEGKEGLEQGVEEIQGFVQEQATSDLSYASFDFHSHHI